MKVKISFRHGNYEIDLIGESHTDFAILGATDVQQIRKASSSFDCDKRATTNILLIVKPWEKTEEAI